jgi:Xaa-Pro aminopeptidase/Xaa-Pro dipeptidase
VTDIVDIRYLTGFTGSSAVLVAEGGAGTFITDSRYAEQARKEVGRPYRVKAYRNRRTLDVAAGVVRSRGLNSLGVDHGRLSHASYLALKKMLPGVRLRQAPGLISKLRAAKDAGEAARIRRSAALLDRGFEMVRRGLAPGVVERELADSVEMRLRRRGAERLAFDTIVASGPNGALPHGTASGKQVRSGELVVVDMGVVVDGYCSDETRTFCIGRATRKHREVYRIVLDAGSRAIEKVRAGVRASAIDRAARNHISRAGYGKYFGHATGHGVGLDIHEPPFIGPKSTDTLQEGMVITVEPGIYMPGWGGVRIEDMLLVTATGCEVLTRSPKDFVCL